MRSYTCSHTSVAITEPSGTFGSSSARSRSRVWPVSTIVQSRGASAGPPTRKRATASIGFCVADSPIRGSARPASASRRSSDNARWLPRFDDASAWISSTMTERTFDSICRPMWTTAARTTTRASSRGCGARLRSAARSACVVSPVRTAVRIAGTGKPSCASDSAMPASGASRFTWMSFDSAFSGDTYTTSVASGSVPSCASASRTRSSSAHRKAVSVLPEPVGAATSVDRPALMCGHASACAPVGAANVRRNHAATAGWNTSSALAAGRVVVTSIGALKWGASARRARVRIESSVCQTSRARRAPVSTIPLQMGPSPHFQRTESCMDVGTPIACRIASNCNQTRLSQPSQCSSSGARAATARATVPPQAAATTIRSQRPLFHRLSEWRRQIHGTPSGFGQSASRCIKPPHAKPNSGAAWDADDGWPVPPERQQRDPADAPVRDGAMRDPQAALAAPPCDFEPVGRGAARDAGRERGEQAECHGPVAPVCATRTAAATPAAKPDA